MSVELSPSLHRTGLPLSVLTVLHIAAGGNLFRALRLAEDYKVNVLKIDRLQIDAAVREREARTRIEARELKPVKLHSKRDLQIADATRSLLA